MRGEPQAFRVKFMYAHEEGLIHEMMSLSVPSVGDAVEFDEDGGRVSGVLWRPAKDHPEVWVAIERPSNAVKT